MLIPRIITAALLVLLVLVAIFYLPPLWFKILAALLVFFAAWELSGLFWQQSPMKRGLFLLASLLIFLGLEFTRPFLGMVAGVGFWVIAPYILAHYTKTGTSVAKNEVSKWLIGILIFIPCLLSLIELKTTFGAAYLLYILVIVWITDIGAYFAGRIFGNKKLAPKISPKKTVEGLLGGLIFALVAAIIGNLLLTAHLNWTLLLLTMVASLWSVIGDLFESMLKREANVKDSGSLLPGHGGVYDRIDSLTAALPIFTLGMLFIH
jgi:phosphatidate cytidylyltransferase